MKTNQVRCHLTSSAATSWIFKLGWYFLDIKIYVSFAVGVDIPIHSKFFTNNWIIKVILRNTYIRLNDYYTLKMLLTRDCMNVI